MSVNLARVKQFEVYGLISYTGMYSGSRSFEKGRVVVMQKAPFIWNLALWFNFGKKPTIEYDLKPTKLLKVDFKLHRPAEKRIIIIRLKNGTNLYFKTLKNESEKDEQSVQCFVKLLKFLQNYQRLNTTSSSSTTVNDEITDFEATPSSLETASLISDSTTQSSFQIEDNEVQSNNENMSFASNRAEKETLRTSSKTKRTLTKEKSVISKLETPVKTENGNNRTLLSDSERLKVSEADIEKKNISTVISSVVKEKSAVQNASKVHHSESKSDTTFNPDVSNRTVNSEVNNEGKSGLEIYLEKLKMKVMMKSMSKSQTQSLNETTVDKPETINNIQKPEIEHDIPNPVISESSDINKLSPIEISSENTSQEITDRSEALTLSPEKSDGKPEVNSTSKSPIQLAVKRSTKSPESTIPNKRLKIQYVDTNEKAKENINPVLKPTKGSNIISIKEKFKKTVVERFSSIYNTRRSQSKIQTPTVVAIRENRRLRRRNANAASQENKSPSSPLTKNLSPVAILHSPKKQLPRIEQSPSPVQMPNFSNSSSKDSDNSSQVSTQHEMPLKEVDIFTSNTVIQSKPKNSATKERKIIGYPNLGNTCYMSCVFQSLFVLKRFTKDLLNNSSIFNNSHSLTESVLSLLQIHYQAENLPRQGLCKLLSLVKKAIELKTESFKGGSMEDAHELLVKLLIKLKEEAEIVGLTRNHNFINPITEHFEFQFCESYSCVQCNHLIQKFPNYYNLSLDLCNSEKDCDVMSIGEALDLYFKPEILDYNCEKCHGKQHKLVKQLHSLPNILIIQLKRYKFIDNNPVKIDTSVSVPQSFCLKPYCNDFVIAASNSDKVKISLRSANSTFMYELVTSIHHDGSLEAGHYYNKIYETKNNMCIEISDEAITQTTLTRNSETGYIFFYCKQKK